ncbi:MAG: LptF/LptG family permease [Pirellulales bacterium]
MYIIDRYLLRQFLQVLTICFCSLTGLYVVFDAFGNLDEFLRYGEQQGGVFGLLAEYYAYRSIFFFDRTSGILALVAAMFTVTWIQRHNELTALAAAGLSTGRVMRPVLYAAMAVALIAALNRELVIPRISGPLSRDAKDLLGDTGRDLQPTYDQKTDIFFRGRQTFANEQKIVEPNFLLPPGLDAYGKQLAAAEASYKSANAEHPSGYLMHAVSEPSGIAELASLKLGDETILFTPRDTTWLKPDECFVASEVNFEQLTGGNRFRQFSSTRQLIRGLRNPSLAFGADVRVTIHSRFVQPLLDITLLLLGLPLVLARENRNIFLAIGLCLGLVTVFMLVVIACQYLGGIYLLSPALAAWLPLMIFLPTAVGMSDALRA